MTPGYFLRRAGSATSPRNDAMAFSMSHDTVRSSFAALASKSSLSFGLMRAATLTFFSDSGTRLFAMSGIVRDVINIGHHKLSQPC